MNTRRKMTWYEKQKKRKSHPFYRLIQRSFTFRLILASFISLIILGLVNRFEVCHDSKFSSDCLSTNIAEIISIDNVESFSIVAAAWIYILESAKRKKQDNFEALERINTFQNSGIIYSLGRIEALEQVSNAGIYLDNYNLQGVNLEYIALPYGRLRNVNLSNTVLSNADLTYTDLQGVNLTNADLTKANLTGANLTGANLTGANLTETNLTNADLTDVILTDVDLTLARLANTILPKNSS